jgi:hypothetical protein
LSAASAKALRRVAQMPVSEEHPLHYTPFHRLLEHWLPLIGRALIFFYLSMVIVAEIYIFRSSFKTKFESFHFFVKFS